MASVRGIGVVGVLALSSAFLVASAAPAAAAVTVTVDPSTGLADGQPVTVTATGFAPNTSVGTAECSAAVAQSRNTVDCDLSNAPIVQTDSSGTAVLHLRAKRTITTANGTVDCLTAAEPCIIGAADTTDISNPDKNGGVAITFDANAPPPPAPDLTVTPSDGLVDRQQVAVYATGFVPGEQVAVGQCAASALAHDGCDPNAFPFGAYSTADPTGAIAVGLTLRRAVRVGSDRIDCAAAFAACVVVARAFGGPLGSSPVGFDDSAPLPPPPTLTVDHTDGLADGQLVQVHGSGFTPNVPVNIVQCPSEVSPAFGCAYFYARYVVTDASGTFTTTTKLERSTQVFDPNSPTPRTIDCAESAGRCLLWAFDYSDDVNSVNVALTFDPNAPPVEPTISVVPADGLVDGQTVHVTGDDFAPGAGLFLVECQTGSTDASGCDIAHLGNPLTDDNGHVDTTFDVHRILTLGPPIAPPPTTVPVGKADAGRSPATAAFFAEDGPDTTTFDCASAPGACTLSLAFLGGPQIEAVSAPLNFDASVSIGEPILPVTRPTDGGGDTDAGSSTPTTEGAQVEGVTISRGPLARTGSDLRDGLRLDIGLLIVGGWALVCAAALRTGPHRRRTA